jgi:DNA-binding GntR family transcriptional regulator
VQLGLRIHEVIARESGNSFICETLLQIYDRLRLLTWIDVLWFDKWQLTREEHRELVDAITTRDEKQAAKIAGRHVKRSREDSLWVITAQHRETNRAKGTNRTRRSL